MQMATAAAALVLPRDLTRDTTPKPKYWSLAYHTHGAALTRRAGAAESNCHTAEALPMSPKSLVLGCHQPAFLF